MPALSITDSPNISSLDFQATFDVPNLQLVLDLTPSVWIGTGYNNVLGAKFTVTAPFGENVPNPTSNTYDLTPPDMQAGTVTFIIPTAYSAAEWGVFNIKVVLTDADSDTYELTKPFDLCTPKQTGIEVGTSNGTALLSLNIRFRDGLGTAYDNTAYVYKGSSAVTKTYSKAIYYDSTLALAPIITSDPAPTVFTLYTGKITFKASVIVEYDLGDNFVVLLQYNGSTFKEVSTLDFCKALCCIGDKAAEAKSLAGTAKQLQVENLVFEGTTLLVRMMLSLDCGTDITCLLDEFNDIMGCDCSCDCGVVVSPSPAPLYNGSIVVLGSGNNTVTQSTSGNTTTFVVNGKTYNIVYGGAAAIPEININTSVSGNVVTIALSLNLSALVDILQPLMTFGGILNENLTATYNSNNTTQNTIYTYTLPAATSTNVPFNTLSKNGDIVRVNFELQNQLGSSTNNRTIRFKFGGATVITHNIVSASLDAYNYTVEIIRIDQNNQQINVHWRQGVYLNTEQSYSFPVVGAQNLAIANIIAVTCQNVSAVANSVVFTKFLVELIKKA